MNKIFYAFTKYIYLSKCVPKDLRIRNSLINFAGLLGILVLFPTCKAGYSFTGASISPEVKTISILTFPNQAPLVQPRLSQLFTETLKQKFVSQTNLSLVKKDGDLSLEGQITGYYTQPIAIQANETASQNRLTISVNVKFTNQKNDKQNFETSFSRYADYDSRLSLSSVEETLMKQINDLLADDIFNKSVSNW